MAKRHDYRVTYEDGLSCRYPASIRWEPNDSAGFEYFNATDAADALLYCAARWPHDDNVRHLQVLQNGRWAFYSEVK